MPARSLKERRWRISGAVLVVCHVALLFVSFRFGQERPLIERPVLLLVGLELIAGVAWLAAVWPPAGMRASRGRVVVMLAVGAILRGLMLPSTPILEDDFYRYLWDGSVLASGACRCGSA